MAFDFSSFNEQDQQTEQGTGTGFTFGGNTPKKPKKSYKKLYTILGVVAALVLSVGGGFMWYKSIVPIDETAYGLAQEFETAMETGYLSESLVEKSYLMDEFKYVTGDPIRSDFVEYVYSNLKLELLLPDNIPVNKKGEYKRFDFLDGSPTLTYRVTAPDWSLLSEALFGEAGSVAEYKEMFNTLDDLTYQELLEIYGFDEEEEEDRLGGLFEGGKEEETPEGEKPKELTEEEKAAAEKEAAEKAKADAAAKAEAEELKKKQEEVEKAGATDRSDKALSFFTQFYMATADDVPTQQFDVELPIKKVTDPETGKPYYILENDRALSEQLFSAAPFRELIDGMMQSVGIKQYNKSWIGAVHLQEGTTSGPGEVLGSIDSYDGSTVPMKYWVKTKAYDTDGNFQDVRIILSDFAIKAEAIPKVLALDARNRGFVPDSKTELVYLEYSIENITDKPIEVVSSFTLTDNSGNEVSRTGAVFGVPPHVTIEPGESVKLHDWANTKEVETLSLIWGKEFPRTEQVVWFKVLSKR